MQPWFRAMRRFDASNGSRWTDYVAWSGLTQLDELVSLDSMLCPDAFERPPDGYWDHSPEGPRILDGWPVISLPFLLSRLAERSRYNVLALFLECDEPHLTDVEDLPFTFLGFDLIERGGDISALSNCGGFPDAFANVELSSKGLLTSGKRARDVQRLLRECYPNEAHADCELWAIYRAKEQGLRVPFIG